ncbi:Chromosome (plasmid) partitioning protein ParB [Microbacterium esteraromaticum]|uniref:Chromosome (Plasmid) partitioning protein ParB n=1 Tax=Microbacterium esteraromaticum TaxID=57043 RepID=A0A1R4I795_9MICO|nr:ParB N-terminal domain-containing protein [Microbacterium esteraromaticum]SJN15556.1 Chromosome (plasmid) partitioning protein ParB [Microbacterium esteraromaticum]
MDSIGVGLRHRQDYGDLAPLVESIRRNGLLQPITITLDGHLICGARRLAAIKLLGWKSVNVWVRSGVSDRLGQLLAEQDENLLHKPLTQLEAAALYRELKVLFAEDALRRQEASRFHAAGEGEGDGGGNFPPPQFEHGKARSQAAIMVTGRDAHKTLERIGRLEDLAADESQPGTVRQRAVEEVERIKAGGKVHPSHLRINAELSLAELDQIAADPTQAAELREQARAEAAEVREAEREARAAELDELAQAALARVKAAKKTGRKPKRPVLAAVEPGEPVPFPLTVFVAIWDDLAEWWLHHDPEQVGPALTDEQWARFEQTIAGTLAFAEAARNTRAGCERGECIA